MIEGRRNRRLWPQTSAAVLMLVLSSCAWFQPERVAVRTTVTQTVPGGSVPGGPQSAASHGPVILFRPGTAGVTGGTPNYASDEGVTTDEIRIGTIQPMDGPAAALGRPLYNATQAYVNALNARGGIHGRRVKLFLQTACINCEAENKLAAKALVEDKHVFAIVNTYMNSYAFSAALDYLNAKHVPLVEGQSASGNESIAWGARQTPWNVYYTVGNSDGARIYAAWLDEVMRHWIEAGQVTDYRAGIVGLDASQDTRRAQEFKKVWEAMGGTHKVVTIQKVAAEEEGLTRMDSVVAKMAQAGAQGVFSATNATMVFGMQAASRQSWKVPWVSKSAWGRTATDLCGSACQGGFTDNNGWGWPGIDTPQMREYKQVMARYYPDSTDDAQTLGGYIGMQAFEYAASRLGAGLQRGPLMDILVNLENFDTGIGARIFTHDSGRGSDAGADHFGMHQTMMLQICNNKFERVSGWLQPGARPVKLAAGCGWGF